jgi:RND family efflux transporter MFP subunit
MTYLRINGGKSGLSQLARRCGLAKLAMAAVVAGATTFAASAQMAQAQVAAPSASAEPFEQGQTRPKHEPKLAFYGPGVVVKVNVEEGQVVKAGELLALQDDRAEVAEITKLQGDLLTAQLQIRASEADLKAKQVQLRRKQELYADLIKRGGSNTELEEAQVAVEIGEIAVKFRTGEYDAKKMDLKAAELKRDLRKLTSPVDGIVSKIDVKAGEGCDLSKPAIQVVQNDILYVEVDVPVAKAAALRIGDALPVAYVDDKDKWMSAKVIYRTPYANAGAGTRKLRLEMANPAGREAGLRVYVALKKADGNAASASR